MHHLVDSERVQILFSPGATVLRPARITHTKVENVPVWKHLERPLSADRRAVYVLDIMTALEGHTTFSGTQYLKI